MVWGVAFYAAAPYVQPIGKFYESLCMASLFEYYIADLAPGVESYPNAFFNHFSQVGYAQQSQKFCCFGVKVGFHYKRSVRVC